MLNYYTTRSGSPVYKIAFQYAEENDQNKAALNFHLTKTEELNIISSIHSSSNQESFLKTLELFTLQTKPEPLKAE